MNQALKSAIIEFLANEFKLNPSEVGEDLSFSKDLGLSPDQLTDLLQRIQDSLNFVLPEDREESIDTVSDLLTALEPDTQDVG